MKAKKKSVASPYLKDQNKIERMAYFRIMFILFSVVETGQKVYLSKNERCYAEISLRSSETKVKQKMWNKSKMDASKLLCSGSVK